MDADAFLIEAIATARNRCGGRVPVVGVAGSQGSGKTTLVRNLAKQDPTVAAFSLDDVYLPRAYRDLIAADVHPLFATRGPPGTHNLMQLTETLDELQEAGANSATRLPAFDKVADNPLPESRRPVFPGRPSLILLDGWCLGATPQTEVELAQPVNELETTEDADGVWRREINANLAGAYQDAFARLDAIVYRRAPGFEVVQSWRCQQEEGLLGRPLDDADRQRIARFVAYFERITRHMMSGGRRADIEVRLDDGRGVIDVLRG
ncbi:MAG: kinase [Alphaproteobacteria bacterium]|nr:kinase [Alphaproteobacteria bacterium]